MTKFIVLLAVFSSLSSAAELGQLAPSKARDFLKTGTVAPELSDFVREGDNENLRRALQLGLNIQKFGNESFIYDLAALQFITEGAEKTSTDLQKKLFSFSNDLQNISQTSETLDANAYGDIFQMMCTLRVAARVALLGHFNEAAKLTDFMQRNLSASKNTGQWQDYSEILSRIRAAFSNSGRPKGAAELQKALSLISGLPPG